MKNFNELPQEVQDKAKGVLRAYDQVNVIFEYGEYHVSAGLCLKAVYCEDHEFVGTYKAVECFRSYPISYKGERDYRWINSLKNGDKVRFDNEGNLISA